MTQKHTPGPWTADVHGFIYAAPDSELPDRANQGASIVVAKVLKHSSGRPIANGKLISAAPDLLAALERIAAGQEMTGEFTHADTVVRYQELARAAIRKATGE